MRRSYPLNCISPVRHEGLTILAAGAPRSRATSLSPRPIRGEFRLLNGGTPMHRGAPRTRAASLSPRPIRGLFWLPWHRHSCLCAMHGMHQPWHRQECLCHSRLVHEGFFHRFRVSIDHRQVGAHTRFPDACALAPIPGANAGTAMPDLLYHFPVVPCFSCVAVIYPRHLCGVDVALWPPTSRGGVR